MVFDAFILNDSFSGSTESGVITLGVSSKQLTEQITIRHLRSPPSPFTF
jgi:hypothetical protein